MHPMLTIAIRAARKAGNLIAKNYEPRTLSKRARKAVMTLLLTLTAMQSI